MDKLRDFLKSWPGRILLILCLSPLALLGVESYFGGGVDPNQIAQVGEASVGLSEYQNAVNNRRSEILEQVDDASLLNEDVLHEQVLKGLIDRTLLEQQAGKLGMTVSDDTINRLLREEEIFKDADGNFSNDQFANFLRQRGMTKNQLFAEFRNQLSLDQLNASIVGTAVYPMQAVSQLIDLQLESRNVWVHRFDWQDYADQVKLSKNDIQAYYDANKDTLKSAAMVNLAYIQLSPQTIKVDDVTTEELQQQYEAYKQSLAADDERRVSQILLTGDDAKARADKVKARLAKGESFAAVAKAESDDPSGEAGGDIGRFNPSVFGGDADAVEKALEGLSVGDVTAPIKTSFGYQIFTVTEDNGKKIPSLESMRAELTAKAKEYKRQEVYADKVTSINDLAADGFSIEDIAQQENVTLKRIKDYRKENNKSVLSQPAVIKQAFDEFTIQDQAVTAGIEVGNGTVWVQPSNYRPTTTLSLSRATPRITQILRQQKATALALKEAKAVAAGIKTPADIAKQSVSLQSLGEINRQTTLLTDKERGLAFSKQAANDGVVALASETEAGATLLVGDRIKTEQQSPLSDMQRAQTASIIRDNLGQDQLQDYLDYLRMVYQVEINEANMANAQGR
ncbi:MULTISPECIES: SurA N-terminal domain-containing protein [Psychrobacter]|jgi:peptidyl-prolyl cis-trans isomerase D|uniref:Periplasmic chaperone PpiD n=2 Tax=Psychrobacter TaxID=497 RepID=A0A1G6VXZ8_9GAMM|nr:MULTISPECIES: SurA N-terminal domain-containing protein [Psychrobacter]GLR28862.1 peptidylprolyl isomerase [Psychrobacter pacificensis]SDD58303.1 peptidyl-prolyl cis-trans isomerase D [Psychrobacter pacificensis]HBD03258.1 peptidylprolyl isomerase [Psychrobacter sp.]|tara:strand:+ start:909 stop:2783 length:1875 start_codon:yes stop_codon:yes gene_type:complete